MSNLTSTFEVNCPCGCGEVITATDAAFDATTVELTACAAAKSVGIVGSTIRKSRAIELAYPNEHAPSRHTDGLVSFGGAR